MLRRGGGFDYQKKINKRRYKILSGVIENIWGGAHQGHTKRNRISMCILSYTFLHRIKIVGKINVMVFD